MQFFSHLAVMKVVSMDTFLRLVQNISRAFDELGTSTRRLSIVAACLFDVFLEVPRQLQQERDLDQQSRALHEQ